ncbi:MAG: hypothetical protein COV33_02385 [Candidatus Zambryskibacteria bacterium CG10_big_fil_rev_8_21_14_0_10_34_34]|uniref:Restriction endonuclease type II Pab1 domain-containing protein n=1 Tax=Candidatus Zambryskibacteria bacterium CG10_big_fil_rev_8_21_14_0_10_34_34 TaxID=1975114 RepID=A0A2H0R119_9BACT|nr:MAG: hypothetical protein COV33_02385 [Candidatus Zambryskibacteria bacterium CG10_big_fil_rev_8_21_14_0_10_34_34]
MHIKTINKENELISKHPYCAIKRTHPTMLYFCFPITELKSESSLIGRCANTKEFAYFEINKNNSFIILEMVKIFGMLSPSHQYDTLEILDLIINK